MCSKNHHSIKDPSKKRNGRILEIFKPYLISLYTIGEHLTEILTVTSKAANLNLSYNTRDKHFSMREVVVSQCTVLTSILRICAVLELGSYGTLTVQCFSSDN